MTKSDRIVSVAQMKERERVANETGVSYYQMMENAGTAAYEIINNEFASVKSMLIFCGKGNNGGDGFVVARLAANDGIKVQIILAEGEPVTDDAKTNYRLLPESVNVVVESEQVAKTPTAAHPNIIVDASNSPTATHPDVIVDALYGTGFHGNLRESGKAACELMNVSGAPVVALDIPSGCEADTCEVADGAVDANITIAFDSWKKIHVSDVTNCGKCVLADIGISHVEID